MYRRASRRAVERVWEAWQGVTQHHRHVKHALASAIMRICHRSTSVVFGHWKEYVVVNRMLRQQQQQVVQRLLGVRLQQCWAAWRSAVSQTQQHKVSFVANEHHHYVC